LAEGEETRGKEEKKEEKKRKKKRKEKREKFLLVFSPQPLVAHPF